MIASFLDSSCDNLDRSKQFWSFFYWRGSFVEHFLRLVISPMVAFVRLLVALVVGIVMPFFFLDIIWDPSPLDELFNFVLQVDRFVSKVPIVSVKATIFGAVNSVSSSSFLYRQKIKYIDIVGFIEDVRWQFELYVGKRLLGGDLFQGLFSKLSPLGRLLFVPLFRSSFSLRATNMAFLVWNDSSLMMNS